MNTQEVSVITSTALKHAQIRATEKSTYGQEILKWCKFRARMNCMPPNDANISYIPISQRSLPLQLSCHGWRDLRIIFIFFSTRTKCMVGTFRPPNIVVDYGKFYIAYFCKMRSTFFNGKWSSSGNDLIIQNYKCNLKWQQNLRNSAPVNNIQWIVNCNLA